MKKLIDILRDKYGSYRKTAKALEITERRLMQIKASGKTSASLKYRIEAEAKKATRESERPPG